MLDPQFRRALAYVAPYWRRLVPVVVLSLASTGTALLVPLLSRALIDDALLAGDAALLVRIVAAFVGLTALGFLLNVASGLRYTRVSAEILFDMRIDLYRHLQTAVAPLLRPHADGRHRVAAQQRHRRDPAGRGRGGPVLDRQPPVPGRLGRDDDLARRPAVPGRPRRPPAEHLGPRPLPPPARGPRRGVPRTERGHRELPHRDPVGDAPGRHVERAGPRGGPVRGSQPVVHRRAHVDAAGDLPGRRVARRDPLGRHGRRLPLRRLPLPRGHAQPGDARRVHDLPDAPDGPRAGADGALRQPRHRQGFAGKGARDRGRAGRGGRGSGGRGSRRRSAAPSPSTT